MLVFRKRRKIFKNILINAYAGVSARRCLTVAKIQLHVSFKILTIATPSCYGSKVNTISLDKSIFWINIMYGLADWETKAYQNLVVLIAAYSNVLISNGLAAWEIGSYKNVIVT